MNVKSCDRCDSKIASRRHNNTVLTHVTRHNDDGWWETKDVMLCSMCLDELWQWTDGDDIDRSDVADPVPLERMADGVSSHIEELESCLEQLNNEADWTIDD